MGKVKVNLADPLFCVTTGTAILLAVLFVALDVFGDAWAIYTEAAWLAAPVHSFLVLATLSIAFLALGRYQVLRDAASYWTGMGFAGFGVGFLFYTLCFPGVWSNSDSILSHLSSTSAWVVTFVLSLFGVCLLAAVLSRWPGTQALAGRRWLWTVAAGVALVSLICVLFIAFEGHLPLLVALSGSYTSRMLTWQWGVVLAFGVGALLSLWRYLVSGDALLGYVSVAQVSYTFAMIALQVGARRYALWWFLSRMIFTGGSIVMMFGLLGGYVRLYTERRLAEETLRQSEERFRSMYTNAAVGIQQLANDGRLLMVNEAFGRMLGYSENELLGRDVIDLTHPDDRARNNAVRGPTIRGERDWHEVEKRYVHRDGWPVWVHITSSVVKDASGHPLYRIAIVQDITQRKRAEEERRQAEEALLRSEKLASVGRMAATIAHEINNPLEALANLLFIAKSVKDTESAHQYLDLADAELKRITHITRQSLGFYRESNASALMSVNEALESAVDVLESKIKAKQAVIEKQWSTDVQLTGVAGELRQVFSNLVANSLDAIDANGTIKLRVSTGADFNNSDRYVRVTVADNGKGISAGSRQHIFEPFFTTKGAVGTGLGLWVSKQIIDKHGGTIRVRSSSNGERRGTVFSVVLPVEPARAVQSQSAGA